MTLSHESALVVLAPEAEPWVKYFRDQYDPSAAEGMPAHITVLYPFRPPTAIDQAVTAGLQRLFARFSAFHYTLAELGRFPGVLYLAPIPDAPFKALTQAVFADFPDTPPYGGAYAEVVPHLTLAHHPDSNRCDQIASDFIRAAGSQLPIHAMASQVALMDNTGGVWKVQVSFRLPNG